MDISLRFSGFRFSVEIFAYVGASEDSGHWVFYRWGGRGVVILKLSYGCFCCKTLPRVDDCFVTAYADLLFSGVNTDAGPSHVSTRSLPSLYVSLAKQAMLDAFLVVLNMAAFIGYGTIPLDVFFPDRVVLATYLPPGRKRPTWRIVTPSFVYVLRITTRQ